MMTEIFLARRARMGQGGFSTMGAASALFGTLSLGGLLAMNSSEQVAASESTACQFDKQIVMTAVEAYYLTGGDLSYPAPAGTDGLDAVRDLGYLRTESKYWRYVGSDGKTPMYEQIDPAVDCN